MNWLRAIRHRLRALFRKQELDRDMDDELWLHIELQTQANLDAGMSPTEARLAARYQFGWVESIKERCREQRGGAWLDHLLRDVRLSLRMLRRNPGFTSIAILSLGLGLGLNTAIFSAVYAVLLHPLRYPASQQLVQVRKYWHPPWAPLGEWTSDLGLAETLAWERHPPSCLAGIAAYSIYQQQGNLTGGGPSA